MPAYPGVLEKRPLNECSSSSSSKTNTNRNPVPTPLTLNELQTFKHKKLSYR